MNLEVTKEELALLEMLLSQAETETGVEIHHAKRSFQYREYLREREKQITSLLERVRRLSPGGI